jgi:tRNA(adenine34) deaminase
MRNVARDAGMSGLPGMTTQAEQTAEALRALDEAWMREALAEAKVAADAGDVPVGAVVVDAAGQLVGRGRNRREAHQDPTAHAEVEALRDAAQRRRAWRLEGCTVYVTLEPCPMCAGALVNARVARVVYGCADPKAGAVDTLFSIGKDLRLNHRYAVTGGVLSDSCAGLLRAFFAVRRGRSPASPATDLPVASAAPGAPTPGRD